MIEFQEFLNIVSSIAMAIWVFLTFLIWVLEATIKRMDSEELTPAESEADRIFKQGMDDMKYCQKIIDEAKT